VQTLIFHPWLVIPALLVILVVLGFNFVGDGLRDAVDPYSR
jgi:peptide/nickel transport system permease protein